MKRPTGFDRPSAAPTTTAPDKGPAKVASIPRPVSERETKARVRAASRERKSYEKREVKRFTRRARSRRRVLVASILIVGVLATGIGVATYSPLLSLEK